MLEKEIEHQRLRGVTPEQYQEIEENFKQFDKDHDGYISRRELKGCMYSLGEEKGRNEITEILKSHGDGNRLSYDQFKEFMIHLLGDADTKEEIVDSFRLVNRGNTIATEDKLAAVMEDDGIKYFITTAPAVDGGYNYNAWTEDVFSR